MTRTKPATREQLLAITSDGGGFSEGELDDCDEPVRSYFRTAIVAGTPHARVARLRMRGSIKIGKIWVPFRSEEILAPLHGYSWPARVAGGLLRGSDAYYGGAASMSWRVLGLVPVIRASGPDVARSAMGRALAEAVWVPTALLPRYGVRWRAEDEDHLVAEVPIGNTTGELHVKIDNVGLVTAVHLDRWNDADGTGEFDWCPFGIEARASRRFSCGITMPAEGLGGWFHDTDRWDEGAFFRYAISEMTLN